MTGWVHFADVTQIPSNPAVIFALTKMFDDSGLSCSTDGLSEVIRQR